MVCWILTSLCHSNGHIETMPAREINPFTALTRIRSQFLRTQRSTSNHQRVNKTTPQTAQPSGLASTIWRNHLPFNHHKIVRYFGTNNVICLCILLTPEATTEVSIIHDYMRNTCKCKKWHVTTLHPPPPPQTTPTFEIQNQNKGIEDIMDIDSNCPYLLFGETTSHLTSKWTWWRGTFQYYIF